MTNEITPEVFQEMIKCSCDPTYFIKTYVLNNEVDDASMEQLTIWTLEAANHKAIELGDTRAELRTEFLVGYAIWYAIFNPNQVILMGTHVRNVALTHTWISTVMKNLPDWLQPNVKELSNYQVVLTNSSIIRIQPLRGFFGKGTTINLLLIDDWELITPSVRSTIVASIYPCIPSTGRCMIAGSNTEWPTTNK